MKKFNLTFLFISFFFAIPMFADITYPYSIHFFDFYEGGKLYIAQHSSHKYPSHQQPLYQQQPLHKNDSSQNKKNENITKPYSTEPLFYFVKTSWIVEDEMIYYWNGLKRNNAQGQNISDSYIIDAAIFNNNLMLILKENNNIYLAIFDTAANIKTKYFLDSNVFVGNINLTANNSAIRTIQFVNNPTSKKLFLLNKQQLFEIHLETDAANPITDFNLSLVSHDVIGWCFFENRDDYHFAYIVDKKDYALVYFINNQNFSQYIARIPMTNYVSLLPMKNYLAIIHSSNNQSESLVSLIDIHSSSTVALEWLNSNFICYEKNTNNLFALINEKNDYTLAKIESSNIGDPKKWTTAKLPQNIYYPIKIEFNDNLLLVFCKNAIVIYDLELNEIAFDFFDLDFYISQDFDLNIFDKHLILSSTSGSLIFRLEKNALWFVNRQILNSYGYVVPAILLLCIVFLSKKYQNQKRLLDAVLDLPSTGFVFLISKSGKLLKTNEGGKQILDISDNIPLRHQFRYYCKTEHSKPLAELIENGLSKRLTIQQKINIIDGNYPREWFCSLIPLRNIAGSFKGIILTGVDITEELEKKTLTNWAQLAHDMQTNLSTIRLNAEQIEAKSEDEKQRKSKIIHQVTILIQRVKDIVTIGRDDKLKNILVNSVDFCNEIIDEFDNNLFSNVRFKTNLADFNFLCDKPKLIRAVRNAVENGIKSMKSKGGILTISCSKDIHNITIVVEDTGMGMDETTKKLILTPFYSTARKEGGSGIGTMIMQRVAELHGGKLIVNSNAGIGTEIIFLLPDLSRKKI